MGLEEVEEEERECCVEAGWSKRRRSRLENQFQRVIPCDSKLRQVVIEVVVVVVESKRNWKGNQSAGTDPDWKNREQLKERWIERVEMEGFDDESLVRRLGECHLS